jgi:hypothetical protein
MLMPPRSPAGAVNEDGNREYYLDSWLGAAGLEVLGSCDIHRVLDWRSHEMTKHLLVLVFCLFLVMIGFGITKFLKLCLA